MKSPTFSRFLCLSIAITTSLSSAIAKPTDVEKKVTFEDDVKPIFRQHCLTCHNQNDKRGGLALDSYSVLLEGGGSGEVVFDDGDVEASRLWQLVNHDDTPVMPPEQSKIPAEQLATLRAWIEGGILENSGSKAKAKAKNALAFAAPSNGKPEGPPPMPKSLPQTVPVVTDRAAAVTAIGTSPWAPLVAVAGQKQIVLYHGESGELLGVLPFEEGIPQSLRFSRDGRFLVVGGGEHSVRGLAAVYEIETGQRVASVGDDLDIVFDADCNDKMSRIALGGPQRMLRIYDATDSTLLFDIKKHTDWIYAVAFSPDGVLVASADRSGGLCVWEAETGRLYLDLTDHKGAIHSLSWRDDSNVLASGSEDGTVKLWDMIAGKAAKSISVPGGGVMAVHFDHQGQIVTAGKDRVTRLWDALGKQITAFPAMPEMVLEAAITHDSSRVVYGDWSGQIKLTLVADPAKQTDLAANPKPVQARLQAIEQTLTSIQGQLEPLAKKQQETKQNWEKAEQQLKDAESALAAKRTESEKTKQGIPALNQAVDQQTQALKPLVEQSNQLQSSLTAARSALGDSVDLAKLTAVADQEAKLAESLGKVAQARKSLIGAIQKKDSQLKLVSESEAAVKANEQAVIQQRTTVQNAKSAFEEAKKAHDALAGQLSETEAKKQKLADAIQG